MNSDPNCLLFDFFEYIKIKELRSKNLIFHHDPLIFKVVYKIENLIFYHDPVIFRVSYEID